MKPKQCPINLGLDKYVFSTLITSNNLTIGMGMNLATMS